MRELIWPDIMGLRPAFRDMYTAQSRRIAIVNDFLVDTFRRTRRTPPRQVIIDLDPTDDPTHGQQELSGSGNGPTGVGSWRELPCCWNCRQTIGARPYPVTAPADKRPSWTRP